MNTHQMFRRSRVRLALWYAIVTGVILSVSGLGMYRSLVRSNWVALEREIESNAGTLHDSLEPLLLPSENPTKILQKIFPDLCSASRDCETQPSSIERHTIGISDRDLYYIRLFDRRGRLLAFSPNQPLPLPQTINPELWQTFRSDGGIRYRQFTTILHGKSNSNSYWGYLQIGRTLEGFDAEVRRIQLILAIGFPIALSVVAISSWWLSGLAMQPIYRSYRQQQQFTADAAHELRSPLASLLATVEAILRLPSGDRKNLDMMLNTVERQGRRLSHLIADLLLLSSLEKSGVSEPFQPCCLNDIIADLSEEFLELAIASNIRLSAEIPEEHIYVSGDESQLYRLVSNLIANAIQYTPDGGRVGVSLKRRDCTAVVAIEDTGIGIPPAEQNRIFERFYRVDSHRSRKAGGTGLGLAIGRAIALKHRARLKVESQPGWGSIFTLEISVLSEPLKNTTNGQIGGGK